MSHYSIPTLIGSLSAILLGVFVFTRNPKAPINIAYGLFCLSLFGWLFGYTIVYSAKEPVMAMTWTRIACAFATFTAPAFYHLAVEYLNKIGERKFVYLAYSITFIFFLLFIFTDVLLTTPYKYSWGYYSHAGTFHPLYLAGFFGFFLRGFYLLFLGYFNRRRLSAIEGRRIAFVFFAYAIALLGAVDYIQKYGIDIYPFGWLFEVAFALMTAYAITKARLMDISVVISRTTAYVMTVAFLGAIYLAMFLVYRTYVSQLLDMRFFAVTLIYGIFVGEAFQRLRLHIQTTADKLILKGKYDYSEVLMKISQDLSKAMSIEEINRKLAEDLKEYMDVGRAEVRRVETNSPPGPLS